MLVASSCASLTTHDQAMRTSEASAIAEEIGTPRSVEGFELGASTASPDDDAPPITAGGDSPVSVRTGDTLGELAATPDVPVPAAVEMVALGIDAPVVPAGIDADGAFDLPPGSQAGWYRFGPAPGDRGSAVLAAHVDWNGAPGAFFPLRDAALGDRLSVAYDDGSIVEFEVVSVEDYVKTELPLEELFARDGPPQLALITCGGEFDRETRSYASNVVVLAVPV